MGGHVAGRVRKRQAAGAARESAGRNPGGPDDYAPDWAYMKDVRRPSADRTRRAISTA